MKKEIKISISIEKNTYDCGNIECRITDMLFTDISSNVLESATTINQIKKFISKFKTIDMLSIDLTCGNEYDSYQKVINSYRYVMIRHTEKDTEFKRAKLSGNTYTNWLEGKSIKDIYQSVKDITEEANRLFIDLLKKETELV